MVESSFPIKLTFRNPYTLDKVLPIIIIPVDLGKDKYLAEKTKKHVFMKLFLICLSTGCYLVHKAPCPLALYSCNVIYIICTYVMYVCYRYVYRYMWYIRYIYNILIHIYICISTINIHKSGATMTRCSGSWDAPAARWRG